jgi:hypothetical protein
MKWLLALLVVAAAAAILLQVLTTRAAPGRYQARGAIRFAWAVLSIALLAIAVFAAHWIGLFSVPLVAVAFVAAGVPLRLVLTGTKPARAAAEPGTAQSRRDRLWNSLELPLLVVLVAGVALLGIAVSGLIGPH